METTTLTEEALNTDAVMFKLQLDGRLKLAMTPVGWCSMPKGYEPSEVDEDAVKYDPMVCKYSEKKLRKALGLKASK